MRAWRWCRYSHAGLAVVGFHRPEFDFEREGSNVSRFLGQHGVRYLVRSPSLAPQAGLLEQTSSPLPSSPSPSALLALSTTSA